ncbi:MAG: ParB/RepB/Spo0J family partition protein [Chthonomonadales bacterium]|nr:ParB/RepB/Spo0J family partition protein [Chthonomonadales bacterium]
MEKRGLGKGLSALLGGVLAQEDAAAVREVGVETIVPNPFQPRREFDPERMKELAQSVREHGVLQPVLVRRVGVDRYELIAGERRLRAARQLGLATIPAIVRDCAGGQALEMALVENVQREDINAVEAAFAYRRLVEEFGLTQEEIARRVGKARSTVANTLRMLTLPETLLDALARGEITEAHARHLLQLGADSQMAAFEEVRRRGLTVKETQRLVQQLRDGPREPREVEPEPSAASPARQDPNLAAAEEALRVALGTNVRIRMAGGVGRIEIEFYSADELDGIVERVLGDEGAR